MYILNGKGLKLARTLVHFFIFIVLGLVMSVPGPTLIDLGHSSGTDQQSISFIYTARSIGCLAGSIIGGVILDYMVNEEIALIISGLFVAFGAFAIPWCRSLPVLLGTFIINGFSLGFSNMGSNVSILRTWGKKAAPFIQCLHFCFGIGGFLAPMIAAPFLSPLELPPTFVPNNLSSTTVTFLNTSDEHLQVAIKEDIPSITYAYTIIGFCAVTVSGLFVFMHLIASKEKCATEEEIAVPCRDPGLPFTIVVVMLACLQTGLISGVEVSFAQMIASYVVKSGHDFTKQSASFLTSLYWASFSSTRLVSIFLTWKINVRFLLIFDVLMSVAASLTLLLFATSSSDVLWVGTIMLGIGVASFFPGMLSWVEKYININNRIAGVFALISSLLEMTVPMLINMHLETQPNILFQFISVATIACGCLFVVLNIVLNRKGEKYIPTTDGSESIEMTEGV